MSAVGGPTTDSTRPPGQRTRQRLRRHDLDLLSLAVGLVTIVVAAAVLLREPLEQVNAGWFGSVTLVVVGLGVLAVALLGRGGAGAATDDPADEGE